MALIKVTYVDGVYDWDGNVEVQGNLTAANIPAPPSSNGTYSLKCTVSG